MKRVAKPEGLHNVVVEEADVPEVSENEILVRASRSLISRGSEIWRRYNRLEAIDHQMMGYSLAGEVVEVGSAVTEFSPGDRVAALAPHAEYAAVQVAGDVRHQPSAVRLPDSLSFEAATFWPLGTSSVQWMHQTEALAGDTMVILGQGLVGSGCMQAQKAIGPAKVVAIDALPLRCDLARELGADEVLDASEVDPVEAVMEMTGGWGADIVVYTVGGRAGPKAFAQGLDMVKEKGLMQVIGLYEDEPLPLNSQKIQRRRLVGGHLSTMDRDVGASTALDFLASGKIQAERMITHRFPADEAPEAFDLLYNRLGETMGVVLVWD